MYANVGCFFLLASGFGSSMVMTLLKVTCLWLSLRPYISSYHVTVKRDQNGYGVEKNENRDTSAHFFRAHIALGHRQAHVSLSLWLYE